MVGEKYGLPYCCSVPCRLSPGNLKDWHLHRHGQEQPEYFVAPHDVLVLCPGK